MFESRRLRVEGIPKFYLGSGIVDRKRINYNHIYHVPRLTKIYLSFIVNDLEFLRYIAPKTSFLPMAQPLFRLVEPIMLYFRFWCTWVSRSKKARLSEQIGRPFGVKPATLSEQIGHPLTERRWTTHGIESLWR